MSTNPFRQTRTQQDPPGASYSTNIPSDSRPALADDSGSRTTDLSLDTKVLSSLDRHVSFASPPVDTTIPAASYPSSPESTRFSPPSRIAQPAPPNYRAAFYSDPLEGLGQGTEQDRPIQEALNNAQSNALIDPSGITRSEEPAARDTLSRIAAGLRLAPEPAGSTARHLTQAARQSLDVDAFTRLLLTGESGQSTPGTATPPTSKHATRVLSDNSSGTDTTSLSQQSIFDAGARSMDDTPRSSHEHERNTFTVDEKLKLPPPAPAPRRGKSVKAKGSVPVPTAEVTQLETATDIQTTNQEKSSKKPPTPPLARRQSHRSASNKSEGARASPSGASSPNESIHTDQKAAPPPPMRRQHSTSQSRPSNDLAPTMEEPEPEPHPFIGSRQPSSDRPMPPPSRNSSTSIRRQSLGFVNPPPLPPPRKGRGSSRSSVDGFRPSPSLIMGEEGSQENMNASESSRQSSAKEPKNLIPSNAESILAELANLQMEVDAARRVA